MKTFDNPVIVTQDEVIEKEKVNATKKKTWRFVAENVRDFGFATSRKFIWDMMVVNIGGENKIALYPKEGILCGKNILLECCTYLGIF